MGELLLPFAHPQISHNFPHSIKVVQKLCGFTGVRVATAPGGLADPKSHQEKRRRDDTALKSYFTLNPCSQCNKEIHHAWF